MNGGQASDDRVIAYFDMPGQGPIVGKNHVIANDAVMRDMAVGEKIPVITNPGH